MIKDRAVWADLLRIFAMFFVVFLHVASLPPTISLPNIFYFINFAIAKTCIALFFMLSGALLLGKDEPYTAFFKKRVLKVIFPWVFWTLVAMAIQFFFQCKAIKTFSELKYFFELTLFTRFWILPVLTGLYLLTPYFRIFIKHARLKDNYYILILWFIVISFLPTLHDGQTFPRSFPSGIFSQVMMCSGFFLGGYILTVVPKKIISRQISYLLMISGICLTIFVLFYENNIDGYAYNIFAPGMVLLATGIFTLFYQSESQFQKWSQKTKHIISTISIASFGVYVTHEALHDFYNLILIKSGFTYLLRTDFLMNYIRAVIIFSIATLLILGIQKIPYIKRIAP